MNILKSFAAHKKLWLLFFFLIIVIANSVVVLAFFYFNQRSHQRSLELISSIISESVWRISPETAQGVLSKTVELDRQFDRLVVYDEANNVFIDVKGRNFQFQFSVPFRTLIRTGIYHDTMLIGSIEGIYVNNAWQQSLLFFCFEILIFVTGYLYWSLLQTNKNLSKTVAELHETREQLLEIEKQRALGDLIVGLSHELNTPLGVIITGASHLMRQLEVREHLDRNHIGEVVGTLSKSANKLKVLIQNLRKLNQQSDNNVREIGAKDFLVNNILVQMKLAGQAYQLNIECNDEIVITTFLNTLKDVLAELVDNSIAHASGDRGLTIYIEVEKVDDSTHFYYSDSGPGIPDSHWSQVFNPFFTTKRGQGFYGMGLHIVYHLITIYLNGRIELQNRYGRVVFHLEIPDIPS